MSERRIDICGRDVTDFPGLWSDEDKVIPAKPEELQVTDGKLLIGTDNNVVFTDGFIAHFVYVNELRTVIAWLQQVAEWREAQESTANSSNRKSS